jgi:hypothetical protein
MSNSLQKIWGSKQVSFQILELFKPHHLAKGQTIPLEKITLFLNLNFLANGMDDPPSNLT